VERIQGSRKAKADRPASPHDTGAKDAIALSLAGLLINSIFHSAATVKLLALRPYFRYALKAWIKSSAAWVCSSVAVDFGSRT
jgi:hypothetical protein